MEETWNEENDKSESDDEMSISMIGPNMLDATRLFQDIFSSRL